MDLVLAIDLGTSYFKLGLFDRAGHMRGLGRVAVVTDSADPTRCELPVERFWSTLQHALIQAMEQAQATPSQIRAVAYSSQANSFVLLGDGDEPLTPLVLWPDTRGGAVDPAVVSLCNRPDFVATTGLGIGPVSELMIAKLRYIRQSDGGLWAKVRRIFTISDYLVHSLTGLAAGDQGTASMLGLLDLGNRQWWPPALEAVGVGESMLPSLLPPGSPAGPATPLATKLLKIPAGTPVAVGSLDHYVAALGAGAGQVAEVCESTGTVLAAVRYSEDFQPRAGTCLGPSALGGWCQMAFDGNGASALQWYHERHADGLTIPQLLELAAAVPPGCDGLTALPCANLHDGLEGFSGRRPSHGHGHYTRAILESTAGTLAELVKMLRPEGPPKSIVATGGGARSDLWLSIKADVLGAEFIRPACQEPACMGAAMIAAVAAGWFKTLWQASISWSAVSARFSPTRDAEKH